MTTNPAPLEETAESLRSGRRSPIDLLDDLYGRVDALEADVRAWVDGPKPRAQLEAEAEALERRYPDPDGRPPLYGVPVGVKDIFHVNGLPTQAGSDVPPDRLVGGQAAVVSSLREAGALVLGKTVTSEFAFVEPGPTRNPHDTEHTPGGSSSGSAAAVAAGMCPLALGSQTIGSVIRPASFCGVVGFKPSFRRIPLEGVIPLAPSVDHVGLFTQDVPGMARAVAACIDDWDPEPTESGESDETRPVFGVPDEDYLDQASDEMLDHFESRVEKIAAAGYDVRRVPVFRDIDATNERHERLVIGEMALTHHEWFEDHAERYADATREQVRDGKDVSVGELADARRGRFELRESIHRKMADHEIDVFLSPAARGPPPEGLETTGDPVMNLPWTHAGLPVIALPAGRIDGLPVGLQCAAEFEHDEELLRWMADIVEDVGG